MGMTAVTKRLLNVFASKGDLLAGTGVATPSILSVGADSSVLMADSTQTAGLRWQKVFALKNYLINGNFDIWQRGTTWSTPAYTADRWAWPLIGNGAGTVSQIVGAGGVGAVNSIYGLSLNVSGASSTSSPTIEQRIESVTTLQAQQVTFSAYVGGTVGKSYTVQLTQHYGTGGSPSADVTTTLGSFTIGGAGWGKVSFTTTVPVASGTLGTNGDDCLKVQIVGALSALYTFNLAQVQLEPGGVATAFEYKPFAHILRDCQRYYHKSYEQGTNPGTATGRGTLRYAAFTTGTGEQNPIAWYPCEMRKEPTLTFYSELGSAGFIRDLTAASDLATSGPNQWGTRNHCGGPNLTAGHVYSYHYTADAEI